ncbi:DUF1320 domain-containing protein [Serratia ureilytica]
MVLAFGDKECISLTDRKVHRQIDAEVMAQALEQSSAEIDGGYLRAAIQHRPIHRCVFCRSLLRHRSL